MNTKRDPEVLHEALQEPDTVARYLHAIADGIASGTLRLSSERTELELHPHGLVAFEFAAQKQHGRCRLRVRLTWREDPPPQAESEGLQIRSE